MHLQKPFKYYKLCNLNFFFTKLALILLFFFIIPKTYIFSQTKPANNRSKKNFSKALNKYYQKDTLKALKYCNKAIKKDSHFTEPYVLKAEIFYAQKKYNIAIKNLKKVISIDSNYNLIYYLIGNYYLKDQNYKNAIFFFEKYLKKSDDQQTLEKASLKKNICKFRLNAINNPLDFKPIRLNNNINTKLNEYFPTISVDNKTLFFTKKQKKTKKNIYEREDIFFSNKINDKWQKAKLFSENINSRFREGAHTISIDGKTLIFTRCTPTDGCDFYITKLKNKKWTTPKPLPSPVNSKFWESQPSLSPDGKTLYFCSNRPGGKGKTDIWKSNFINGKWDNPINLGDSINTSGKEMSPFIHFDNKTLFFVSDTHIGMGKFDIFFSKKTSDTTWSKPKNIGFPINTKNNEFRLVINATADTGYFSAKHDTNFNQDIFIFPIPKKIQPEKTLFLKAKIFSSNNKKIYADKIKMTNLDNNKTIFKNNNIHNFTVCLSDKKEFSLNIIEKNYIFYSENYNLKNISDSVTHYKINIFLKPIKEKSKITLKNLFFETDSYKINPKSFVELNELAEFLIKNPDLKIHINGHTDSIGNYDYNIKLSENRAHSVKKYLISKKISAQRIFCKGFGYTMPVANNQTPLGRKQNRRTEIIILKK